MKTLILFLLAFNCFGQNTGQNVVNVLVLNSVVYNSTTTVDTPIIQNVGQTSHTVKIIFSAITGTNSYQGVMQGSGDCTNYNNIGPVFVTTGSLGAGNNSFQFLGYGSYPCLRIHQTITISGGHATAYETYIGVSTPVFSSSDEFGSVTGLLPYAANGTLTYSTNTVLIGTTTGAGIAVYGLEISMPTAFTDIVLFCTADGGTTQGTLLAHITNAANSQVVWPLGLRPYIYCPVGNAIGYNATGSGAGIINAQYRYE